MIDISNIYKQVFRAIKEDETLLSLIGIKVDEYEQYELIQKIRSQVYEGTSPDDILTDYSTRLCLHEKRGAFKTNANVGFFQIDVHVTKDKNTKTGILSRVIKRVIEVIDSDERRKCGLPQLQIGLNGLRVVERSFSPNSGISGWEKYTIIFEYRYL